MSLQQFMTHQFPGLELRSPLFYSWPYGIRFELGVSDGSASIHEQPSYLSGVYERAVDLFESLHSPEDDLYLVVDVHKYGNKYLLRRKLNVFAKYVKMRSVLYHLQQDTRPFVYSEESEEETCHMHRFSLRCRRSDIRYGALLQAICNQDMGKNPMVTYPVYFVNETKGTIFYVYDDRGCDLVGVDIEVLRPVYERYHEWILDYDRVAVDKLCL